MQVEPRGKEQFSWEARGTDAVLSVIFRGEIDLAVTDNGMADLDQPMAGPERIIVLDMRDVTFIDSTGLRMLIRMKERVEGDGKQFLINDVSPPVRRILEVTGLRDLFEYLNGHSPTAL